MYMDPYNIFHSDWIRDNGIEPNKNYIKTKYIINNPDMFDSFIFGSSRVGYIHNDLIPEQKSYNMTYSEGTPHEIYETLKVFVKNNVKPKVIYVGVDSLSYTIDPKEHRKQGLSAPYIMTSEDPYHFWKLYFDPAVCFEAYTTITYFHVFDEEAPKRFYRYGWSGDFGPNPDYDFEHMDPSIGKADLLDETLEDIQNIVDICKENDIECVIFTNPMHQVTYEESLNRGYYEFLRGLAEITEFCNFSGYNDISTNNDNWVDNSHYNANVGELIRESITYRVIHDGLYEQGFGYWVDENNIDSFISLLKTEREKYQ